jgi:hypothetical protein
MWEVEFTLLARAIVGEYRLDNGLGGNVGWLGESFMLRRCSSILFRHPGRCQRCEAHLRPIGSGEDHHPIGQSAERCAARHIYATMHQQAATDRKQCGDHLKPKAAESKGDEHLRKAHSDHKWQDLKDID